MNMNRLMTYGGLAALVALALYLMISPSRAFRPHWDEYSEQVCHIGSTCELSAQAATVWSEENITRYAYPKGVGFRLTFTKFLQSGKPAGSKTFELHRWETFQEEGNNYERTLYIERQRKAFDKMLTWWRSPAVDHHRLLLVTDVTSKIDPKEAEFIRRNLYDLKLAESVAAGDSLDLTTCLVTEDPDAMCDRLRIADNEKARAGEIKPKLEAIQMLMPKARDHTALYERLRSILAELARGGAVPEEVYVYTDGMQFNGAADFYSKHLALLMNKDKWGELIKVVEPDDKKWANLRGTAFVIFRPHREMPPAETKQVDAALAFLVEFLHKHDAVANIVNE